MEARHPECSLRALLERADQSCGPSPAHSPRPFTAPAVGVDSEDGLIQLVPVVLNTRIGSPESQLGRMEEKTWKVLESKWPELLTIPRLYRLVPGSPPSSPLGLGLDRTRDTPSGCSDKCLQWQFQPLPSPKQSLMGSSSGLQESYKTAIPDTGSGF